VHAQKLLAQELGDPVSGLRRWPGGPRRESQGNKTAMHGHGKSDSPEVPQKSSNKGDGAPPLAERTEGRGLAKGNLLRQNKSRTLGRLVRQYGES
jgi:hypothetical protein